MPTFFVYVFLISFVATLVRSTFGFGESLVAVPLFSILMPIEVAVPLSVLMSVIVALVVVIQDHKKIDLGSAKWLIIYAVIGIPLGLLLLIYGNEHWIKIGLGGLIILYSVYSVFAKSSIHLEHDSKFWLFICGFLSGILGGAYGVNGPPLVVYGNLRRWNAKQFRATLQGYFLPVSFVGLIGYFAKGLMTTEVLKLFAISLPAVIPAIFLGRFLNHRLRDGTFFKYVYLGLLLIGVFLIADTAMR
ncbi:sulfite exporter TauE/SafE family protein [Taibaiella soli]|uniref:Probable membrane transporter protein n=1 Tax=Taibaiella soli TaxID=1649169 RepID=A0A2W2B8R3_9BACT|nr:sulfite exporter TauE/SafE family protein [Taibaiella soli]PZF72679.1 sulfite exporter TauE/SafE family protein [Taibaiella soli]